MTSKTSPQSKKTSKSQESHENIPLVKPSREEIRAPGYVPARDEKGRLLPGHCSNPSGVSKAAAEVKEMSAHVLNNIGWDKLIERMLDPATPAAVIVEITKFLRDTAHGKPGIRKEDREMDHETYAQIIPTIQITPEAASKLSELGISPKVGKPGTKE